MALAGFDASQLGAHPDSSSRITELPRWDGAPKSGHETQWLWLASRPFKRSKLTAAPFTVHPGSGSVCVIDSHAVQIVH